MLLNLAQILGPARHNGFAVGGFNVTESTMFKAIVEQAEADAAPLIVQVSPNEFCFAEREQYLYFTARLQRSANPFVLHYDHSKSYEGCVQAVQAGFTSVMFDGSHLPFEENIAVTRRVADYAHERGVWVEAELGQLAGVEEHVSAEHSVYTDPDQAVEFVQRSGCDSLAVAIGTSHGAYKFKGEAKLDFARLDKITALLPGYPLVLHGASSVPQEFVDMANKYGGKLGGAKGVPEDMLRQAARSGVCKINIDSDIRLAMTAYIRRHLAEHPEDFDPRAYLKPAREAVREMVQHKIKHVLGCSGKA